MNTDAVWIASIVALASMVSPLLLAHLTNRQRRIERREDYARQDQVADQAAEAARLLAERQDETAAKAAEAAKLLLAANERVALQTAEAAEATHGQLEQIHTLVNSALTSAMEAELAANIKVLALMNIIDRLDREAGREQVPGLAPIEMAQQHIDELKQALRGRHEQTKTADAQATQGGK